MAERQASTKRRSAKEWQTLVSKLAESGEDLAQFCGRQGIYPPTLRWWLEPQVLPKSALATAIGYTRRQWAALERYLDDGELVPDNSASERALRGVALGRKNWLFAGSDAGGVRAAKLYSLIASAKRHALEPYAYLRALFERLPSHPADRLHELAPALWSPHSASR